jgi:N-acetylmuramoyl-L-alanine amidase
LCAKTSCFNGVLSHNEGVPYRGSWYLVLFLILAGCATPHQPPPDAYATPQPEMAPEPVAKPAPVTPPPNTIIGTILTSPPPTNQITNAPVRPEGWVQLDRWCQEHGFVEFRRTTTQTGYNYSFVSTNAGLSGTMVLTIGSQIASWRGMEYHLGFAPVFFNNHPFVHSLDIRKNFLPLLDPPIRTKENPVIVIDPGHGGTDIGAKSVYNGHTEKEYTLDWARRLQAILSTNGWTVWLTRTNDTFVPLTNRVAFADFHKADFFLSLHFNSVYPDAEAAGLQTYCLTPVGMPSNETRGFKDDWSLMFTNNNFDTENVQYAARLHRAMLKANGHLDRGVQRARFIRVVREQDRPAVLMEGGFLSNLREARHIADPAYRERIAEALAEGLMEEMGHHATVTNEPIAMTNAPPTNAVSAATTNHSVSATNSVAVHEKSTRRGGTQ